jgi:6-phosphogluconolactonase/glucosamine-6-phosphate isomerase/deaminase
MSSLFDKLSSKNNLKTSFKKLVVENFDEYYKFRCESRHNINNYDEFYHKIKTMMILGLVRVDNSKVKNEVGMLSSQWISIDKVDVCRC